MPGVRVLSALWLAAAAATAPVAGQALKGLQAADIYRLRSVGDVQLSPDGRMIVYSVNNNDRPMTGNGTLKK